MYTCRLKTKMSTKVIGELLRLFFHENSRVDFVNKFEAHFLLVLKIFFLSRPWRQKEKRVSTYSPSSSISFKRVPFTTGDVC